MTQAGAARPTFGGGELKIALLKLVEGYFDEAFLGPEIRTNKSRFLENY